MRTVEVVGALIWDQDKFLICQRPATKSQGLLWEFAGGKVEPGESKRQALIRECMEELDIRLQVNDVFMETTYQYPDIFVRLTVFNATIFSGKPRKIEHNDIRWITIAETPDYQFCPADIGVLRKLSSPMSG